MRSGHRRLSLSVRSGGLLVLTAATLSFAYRPTPASPASPALVHAAAASGIVSDVIPLPPPFPFPRHPDPVMNLARPSPGLKRTLGFLLGLSVSTLPAATYYVDPAGSDTNDGSSSHPFRHIDHAAQIADAGDIVEVRAGTYRERVNPKHSGTAAAPITYRAATGATVYIKGTEPTGYGTSSAWTDNGDGTHSLVLPYGFFFTTFNPFDSALLRKPGHTRGEVYLNQNALDERTSDAAVIATADTWHASVDGSGVTTIIANFDGADPNASANLVEVNKRSQIFAPAATENFQIGYLIVDGFHLEGCANQFPYNFYNSGGTPQYGALSTAGGHHWEIRNCTIRNAKAIGLDFGYLGADPFNAFLSAHGTTAFGGVYNTMLVRGLGDLGHHSIHHNHISQNGCTGIAGMWGVYTTIQRNVIEYNNRLDFGDPADSPTVGYEQGGVKTHQFMGGVIQDNLFRDNKYAALWLDSVDDGVRIHGNVFVDNDLGIMFEVGWGNVLVDANVFIHSPLLHSHSAGAILAQNLFVDCDPPTFQYSSTPARTAIVNPPWTIDRGGTFSLPAHVRENKYYNNLWLVRGLHFPTGNVNIYDNVARWNYFAVNGSSSDLEGTDYVDSATNPSVSYTSTAGGVTLQFTLAAAPVVTGAQPVGIGTTGVNQINGWDVPDADRSFDWQTWPASPPAGPFTSLTAGLNSLTLWPKTANPTIVAPAPIRYRNDSYVVGSSETLTYAGGWTSRNVSVDSATRDASFGYIGGNYHYSTGASAYVTTTFTGSRFLVLGAVSATGGDVDVVIDGSTIATFDTTGSPAVPQTTLFDSGPLTTGTHTIRLQKKDTGQFIFDAFELFD